MLTIQRFIVNFVEENCYVLSDDSGEAVIVDCGAYRPEEQAAIATYIADKGLSVRHQLYTHGHFDHIFGAQFVTDTYGVGPTLCRDEVDTYTQAPEHMRLFIHRSLPLAVPAVAHTVAAGDSITFGTHRLQVIATPGHTPGGVCYYCAEEGLLLSGDSLFRYCIGRTDLPGGDGAALVNALRANILTLPDDVAVYPGHGDATTIGDERRGNPYI